VSQATKSAIKNTQAGLFKEFAEMRTWIMTLVSVGTLCGIGASASAGTMDVDFHLNDMQLDIVTAGSADGDVIHVDTSVTILGVETLDVRAAVLAAVANANTSVSAQTSADGGIQVSESRSESVTPK
jgi:hypothetical protein